MCSVRGRGGERGREARRGKERRKVNIPVPVCSASYASLHSRQLLGNEESCAVCVAEQLYCNPVPSRRGERDLRPTWKSLPFSYCLIP